MESKEQAERRGFRPPGVVVPLAAVALFAPPASHGHPATHEGPAAHGSMEVPVSRSYRCYLEGPESPISEACREALLVAGTQQFYDWHEVNLPNADGRHRELIPDGQLCSAGREKYRGLDLPRSDWPAERLAPDADGEFEFVYVATAPHSTLHFAFFVTREGYDPERPLAWSDLEEEPFCTANDPALRGGRYHMRCPLPEREGRHLIYNIWQRDDSPEAFYACSDVVFGDPAPRPSSPGAPPRTGANEPGPEGPGTPGARPSDAPFPSDAAPPTGAPSPDAPSTCAASPWHPAAVYVAGDVVRHEEASWRAKWWTRGEAPGTTGEWGVWVEIDSCPGP